MGRSIKRCVQDQAEMPDHHHDACIGLAMTTMLQVCVSSQGPKGPKNLNPSYFDQQMCVQRVLIHRNALKLVSKDYPSALLSSRKDAGTIWQAVCKLLNTQYVVSDELTPDDRRLLCSRQCKLVNTKPVL